MTHMNGHLQEESLVPHLYSFLSEQISILLLPLLQIHQEYLQKARFTFLLFLLAC
jgi:hypothetical protein